MQYITFFSIYLACVNLMTKLMIYMIRVVKLVDLSVYLYIIHFHLENNEEKILFFSLSTIFIYYYNMKGYNSIFYYIF